MHRPWLLRVASARAACVSRVVVAAAVLSVSCGGESQRPLAPVTTPAPSTSAAATPTPRTAPVLAPLDVDPVVYGLGRDTAGPGDEKDAARARESIVRLCDEGLGRARALLDEARAMDRATDEALTWDATMGKIDRARMAIRSAGDFPGLMAVAHPDAGVRDAAKTCEPKVDALETGLWLDATLASVVKRYAAHADALEGPKKRLVERVLLNFRRNGLDLPPEGQARLRALNEELTQLGQDFESNLAAAHLTLTAKREDLDGLPKEWLDAKTPNADGSIEISTDYPDYFPVLTYAKNRKLALALYEKFDNRAAAENLPLLDKILARRAEKAKLLGYATWADYATELRMAKDGKTVASFLGSIQSHIVEKGKREFAELRAMHEKLGGKKTDPIPPSDRLYLGEQVQKARYGVDSKEVSQYFEIGSVKKGLFAITSKMFAIRFRPAANATTWHPDVEAYEVTDEADHVLGRFYLDLYPRDGKYKHAAVFSIRDTMRLPSEQGTPERVVPIAALECNFPKPGGKSPALMTHEQAVTFFHEFGHVLHHLLSESELATFAGTSVARDFVEAPSQMLEEWAWAKETLDLFAVHHATGKPMPKSLHAAMIRARSFGRALSTQRQLSLAALDQAYHTRPLPFDTTKVLEEIHRAYTPFSFVEGTHFQATFGHLIGYDAGYYGYQWALSIAQDLLTRFKKEGMLNPKTAADYRRAVLAPGGSERETVLVERFLGRPPNEDAYKAFLVQEAK